MQSDIHIKNFYFFIFVFANSLKSIWSFSFSHTCIPTCLSYFQFATESTFFSFHYITTWSLSWHFSTIISSVWVTHYLWHIVSIFSAYQLFMKFIIYLNCNICHTTSWKAVNFFFNLVMFILTNVTWQRNSGCCIEYDHSFPHSSSKVCHLFLVWHKEHIFGPCHNFHWQVTLTSHYVPPFIADNLLYIFFSVFCM